MSSLFSVPVPADDVQPLAVLRRDALPADERAEADVELSRLRLEGALREPHDRRLLPRRPPVRQDAQGRERDHSREGEAAFTSFRTF